MFVIDNRRTTLRISRALTRLPTSTGSARNSHPLKTIPSLNHFGGWQIHWDAFCCFSLPRALHYARAELFDGNVAGQFLKSLRFSRIDVWALPQVEFDCFDACAIATLTSLQRSLSWLLPSSTSPLNGPTSGNPATTLARPRRPIRLAWLIGFCSWLRRRSWCSRWPRRPGASEVRWSDIGATNVTTGRPVPLTESRFEKRRCRDISPLAPLGRGSETFAPRTINGFSVDPV